MTRQIFQDMLIRWYSRLRIIILVDNCPAHSDIFPDLTNINLFFLSVNTKSVLQPMDAGVIRTFKHNYCKKIVSKLLYSLDKEFNNIKKLSITILDAI